MKYSISTIKKAIIVGALISITITTPAIASMKFKDLNESHWAYQFISFVYDRGLMVGDTSGNFRPNDLIDKFQTSKILSRITGYKYTGASEAETQYYNKVYEKNKLLLTQFSSKFVKWDKSSDHEIAYLLEKQILNVDDLNQFVITTSEGQQKVRALSREEVAMFIVKTMGKNEDALTSMYDFKYADDAAMNKLYKPYIYYLKEQGVFTPDATNMFNPKTGVTRAVMATILEKAISIEETINISENNTPLGSGVVNIASIVGVIDKYYPQVNAIQVISSEGGKTIYRLSSNYTIYIDGFLKTVEDLKMGMSFSAVLNDSDIISINASTDAIDVTPEQNIKEKEIEPTVIDNTKATNITGFVTNISNTYKTITIRINETNDKNETTFYYNDYTFTDDSKITRDGDTMKIENIKIGDNIKATVTDKVMSIDLSKEILQFTGTLKDKKLDGQTGAPVLIVNYDDRDYSFTVAPATVITRKGIGQTTYGNLRLGDTIEMRSINGTIKDLYAYGTITNIEGTIDNIFMSNQISKITLKDSFGNLTVYNIVPNTVDVYSLRIGSKVKLRLDSKEVNEVTLLGGTSQSSMTATIQSVGTSYIRILDNSFSYGARDVKVNSNTIYLDSVSGNKVTFQSLRANTQVYIIFTDYTYQTAKSITIL